MWQRGMSAAFMSLIGYSAVEQGHSLILGTEICFDVILALEWAQSWLVQIPRTASKKLQTVPTDGVHLPKYWCSCRALPFERLLLGLFDDTKVPDFFKSRLHGSLPRSCSVRNTYSTAQPPKGAS